MRSLGIRATLFLALAGLWVDSAAAGTIPVGFISWDVTFPGNAGQFDITNLTGPNSAPPTFPITTLVDLSNLTLVVDFADGSTTTYGPASDYFSLDVDGESWDGSSIPIGGTNSEPIDGTLTGTFNPTSIDDPGADSILPAFSTSFSDTPNLMDGDFGIVYATEGTLVTTTPEPGTWMMLALGLAALAILRVIKGKDAKALSRTGTSVAFCGLLLSLAAAQTAIGQVKLAANTSPSTGVAGVTNVSLTASNVPSGSITASNIIATFAGTCGGAAVATEPANTIRIILGSIERVNVDIPGSLMPGTYYVTLADSASEDAGFTTQAGSCALLTVTGSSRILNACLAGSSMGVLLPAGGAAGNVTAYVPKGYWEGSVKGIFVQNIEGAIGTFTSITTPNVTNSCSSNQATGQTVCVANNTDVYLITGTTLNTTLNSSSNADGGFSGGTCQNCGVALNASNNTAVINMGLTGGASGDGVQILNLNTNTFNAAFPMTRTVSENISVDPTRSLILSADEDGNFALLQIQSDGSLKEFDSPAGTGLENDSNAEDCSTGIGLSPGEFSNDVALVNLNDISFGANTYTAPNAIATLSTLAYSFSAGLSGSAVAQGSGHLGVVTGEFGGNTFAVLQLPAAAGSEVPALVDYAIAQVPANAACGGTFSAGFDPHTITAYTSPNTGDAYAVFAGYSGDEPTCLAVVDMTKVINPALAPRGGVGFGTHEISPANFPSSAVTFFALH